MQTPLSIHALFHSQNPEGLMIYSKLYDLLCRDVKSPFSDGLDIPVYFSTGDDNSNLKLVDTPSKKKVILVFIDIHMFCAENWKKYVAELIDKNENDDNTLIVGIKQYKHAFSFNKKLGEIQSIVVDAITENSEVSLFSYNNWDIFQTRLFDTLIRFISGNADKKQLAVFISHSKKDLDNLGEKKAKEVRDFLCSDTKLNSFFDVHDILDGYKFGDQIRNHVINSVLLILFTDSYSSREWCKKEALTAKTYDIPIVAVYMLKEKVDRSFPYIGNVPGIVFNGDWRKVINLLLRTSLDQSYEKELLSSVDQDDSLEILPYSPEAFCFSKIKSATKKILYPEPPLGNEEIEVLHDICQNMGRNVIFTTPMSYQTSNINFEGKRIAISISERSDLSASGIGDEMYKDLTIELARHILKAGGHLVYGGDLRKNGYTELFKELSNQYGQREKAEADVVYIDNYLSWPIYNNLTLEQKADYINSRIKLINGEIGDFVKPEETKDFIPPTSLENRLKWASSLSKMRMQMLNSTVARIVIGGKVTGFLGYTAGIAEEFMLSMEKHQPVFLVGGFGGATHVIADILEGNASSSTLKDFAYRDSKYVELYEWCERNDFHIEYEKLDRYSCSDLNNGLSEQENKVLFHSVDIVEIVSLILKGLSNTFGYNE